RIPTRLSHANPKSRAVMARIRPAPLPSGSQKYPRYAVNALLIAAAAAIRVSRYSQPTSNPTKLPKASLAYRYGPPVLSNLLPASAKHNTTRVVANAASRYAIGLAGPIKAATVAGNLKIPDPMTP